MIKRLSTPRRKFTFTVGCSDIVLTVDDLDDYPHVQKIYENWLESEKNYERDWRNYELSSTDWLLLPDATYSGEPLAGSTKLVEIMKYRTDLRAYNLTTDDRPLRPTWFK